MAKATIISKLTYAKASYGTVVKTTENLEFIILEFTKQTLVIEPTVRTTIHHMAQIAVGCFESDSTFADVKEVKFTFNGKKVSVKKEENATPPMILDKWYDTLDEE